MEPENKKDRVEVHKWSEMELKKFKQFYHEKGMQTGKGNSELVCECAEACGLPVQTVQVQRCEYLFLVIFVLIILW